ncbi:hypothetical protein [Fructobacillus tropaeoli]|uniref:hypothetical protein n=1 Tax=Fructobacillus tropaeoli TaxID=709323 RepID=UPI0030C7B06E
MAIFVRILLGLYALLMIVASIQSIRLEKRQGWFWHSLNLILNMALIVLVAFAHRMFFQVGSIAILVSLQGLTFYRGFSSGKINWRHHLIRLLWTAFLIVLIIFF